MLRQASYTLIINNSNVVTSLLYLDYDVPIAMLRQVSYTLIITNSNVETSLLFIMYSKR